MTRFFVTFGQASPLKDGWIEVLAPSAIEARLFASEYPHWCGCYPEDVWERDRLVLFFPVGRIGAIVSLPPLPKDSIPDTNQNEDCATAQPAVPSDHDEPQRDQTAGGRDESGTGAGNQGALGIRVPDGF